MSPSHEPNYQLVDVDSFFKPSLNILDTTRPSHIEIDFGAWEKPSIALWQGEVSLRDLTTTPAPRLARVGVSANKEYGNGVDPFKRSAVCWVVFKVGHSTVVKATIK